MSSTQTETILLHLRDLIMRGEFGAGTRLMEIPLAEKLNVSRTPVRLALQALAQEGLLIYAPQRGFMVKAFSAKEIIDAVDVRGRLEAMACAAAAAHGLSDEMKDVLARNIDGTEALLRKSGFDAADAQAWCELNAEFHQTLVEAAGNETLNRHIRQFDSLPLVAARNVAATASNLDRMAKVVEQSLFMHRLVFNAVCERDAGRAESLMREHVHQGREGLRLYLERLSQAKETPPVLKLISEH